MGVIRHSALINSYSDSIEDVLENIEEVTHSYEPERRRPRKIKHKPNRPRALGDPLNVNGKSGKKKKRVENSNFLLSLADPEETVELSIHDFIPQTSSAFTQILRESENLEIWNEFLNCADNDLWFKNVCLKESCHKPEDNDIEMDDDCRTTHPAFSAAECFQKIRSDLRCMLRKKHVPMGALMYLEQELVTFFVNRPQSIYQSYIPSSYERLLVHALCQYMDLSSLSYDRNGARWTRVCNKNSIFQLPAILLSTHLEQRLAKPQHR